MAVEETPKVVEGKVIRTSRGKLLFLCACSGLLAFTGGFLLWDTWGHESGKHILPVQLGKGSLKNSFAAGMCMVGGVGCLIALAHNALFPYQLLLGEEVLQVIRFGLFGSTVETQVPYTNIASVTCERENYGFPRCLVGIDLHRLGAPSPYSSARYFGEKNKNSRDLYLPSFLQTDPKEIARLIEERCPYQKRHSDSRAADGGA